MPNNTEGDGLVLKIRGCKYSETASCWGPILIPNSEPSK
jgi:hypothetical protein